VLSGRGFCDELITRREESYRLCCVVVCDLENLKNEEAMTHVGWQRHRNKKVPSLAIISEILLFTKQILGMYIPCLWRAFHRSAQNLRCFKLFL
jgi:hypothetical protein